MGLCEGDCDDDSDCEDGLDCSFNSAYDIPPGCTGTNEYYHADYCYDPSASAHASRHAQLDWITGNEGEGYDFAAVMVLTILMIVALTLVLNILLIVALCMSCYQRSGCSTKYEHG